MNEQTRMQRAYYAQTAAAYDDAHSFENEAAFNMFSGLLNDLKISSVLDIGSGTGRALLTAKQARPGIKLIGIEPSAELREIGYSKGLTTGELIDGDATAMPFPDGSFDLVTEFAALHHIPNPHKAVAEMLRVARKAILISDCNNFGQGSPVARFVKQVINSVGLWPLANFIKTRGRGYDYSEGDGLSYSYSAFNDLPLIKRACHKVSVDGEYRSSSTVVIIGIK